MAHLKKTPRLESRSASPCTLFVLPRLTTQMLNPMCNDAQLGSCRRSLRDRLPCSARRAWLVRMNQCSTLTMSCHYVAQAFDTSFLGLRCAPPQATHIAPLTRQTETAK